MMFLHSVTRRWIGRAVDRCVESGANIVVRGTRSLPSHGQTLRHAALGQQRKGYRPSDVETLLASSCRGSRPFDATCSPCGVIQRACAAARAKRAWTHRRSSRRRQRAASANCTAYRGPAQGRRREQRQGRAPRPPPAHGMGMLVSLQPLRLPRHALERAHPFKITRVCFAQSEHEPRNHVDVRRLRRPRGEVREGRGICLEAAALGLCAPTDQAAALRRSSRSSTSSSLPATRLSTLSLSSTGITRTEMHGRRTRRESCP